jgi:hypothetical protein
LVATSISLSISNFKLFTASCGVLPLALNLASNVLGFSAMAIKYKLLNFFQILILKK